MMTRERFDREVGIIHHPPDSPGDARRDALTRIRIAAFDVTDEGFPRAAYKELLVELITDADDEMRRASISELAIQKDPAMQVRLRDGLTRQAAPLVPDAWAIQLLAYDLHGDYVELFRHLADDRGQREDARIAAIRGLGGDQASVGRLARMMTDASESTGVRLWSGLSLRALAPPRFAPLARQVIGGSPDATSGELRDMCVVAFRTSPTLSGYL